MKNLSFLSSILDEQLPSKQWVNGSNPLGSVLKNNMMNKKALITGVTGQDGSYLVEFLNKNYEVHGIKGEVN